MRDEAPPALPPDAVLAPAVLAGFLAASTTMIEAEMRALGDDARWHPAAGEWCANEVLGHLLEAERRGFNGRIRRLLSEAEPSLAAWDGAAVAAARHDCDREPAELLEEFLPLRADSIELVRSLRRDDFDRSGIHSTVGRLTVGDVAAEWVHHDRNHIRQILANSQAMFWPVMGNAQRFGAPAD